MTGNRGFPGFEAPLPWVILGLLQNDVIQGRLWNRVRKYDFPGTLDVGANHISQQQAASTGHQHLPTENKDVL